MPDGTSILGRPAAAVMASPPKPKEVNLLGNAVPKQEVNLLGNAVPKQEVNLLGNAVPKQDNKPLVDDLFDSFQTAPMASTVSSPPKSTNDAILSLFSTPSVAATATPIGMNNVSSQPMNGNSLLGDFDAFSAFQSTPSQPMQPMAMNLPTPPVPQAMNVPMQPQLVPQAMNIPITMQPVSQTFPTMSVQPTKKQDDLFADFVSFSNATMKPSQTNDLWGDFK
jgi:hypothetical protein